MRRISKGKREPFSRGFLAVQIVKWLGMVKRSLLAFLLAGLFAGNLFSVSAAFAQDGADAAADDEFYDEEDYLDDEGFEEPAVDGQETGRIGSPGRPGAGGVGGGGGAGSGPRTRFNIPNPGGFSGGGGSGGGFSGSGSGNGEVEFRLVQPPKFWTPKKRKIRSIPQGAASSAGDEKSK